jgi:hypothetical protein
MKLDKFTQAYIECALWSSTAYGSEDEKADIEENGEGHFDASFERCNFDVSDISEKTLKAIAADCQDFQDTNAELLWQYYEQGYGEDNAGHDFWLTRNGHGAGFWDRGLGDIGRQLTDMANPYGEFNLYVGDDGLIHGS